MKDEKNKIRKHLPEDIRDEDIDEAKDKEALKWWQLLLVSRVLDKTDRQRQIGV